VLNEIRLALSEVEGTFFKENPDANFSAAAEFRISFCEMRRPNYVLFMFFVIIMSRLGFQLEIF